MGRGGRVATVWRGLCPAPAWNRRRKRLAVDSTRQRLVLWNGGLVGDVDQSSSAVRSVHLHPAPRRRRRMLYWLLLLLLLLLVVLLGTRRVTKLPIQ